MTHHFKSDNGNMLAVCGMYGMSRHGCLTDDWGKVTCQRCLRIMSIAPIAPYQEKFMSVNNERHAGRGIG